MIEPGQQNHIDESGDALSLKIIRMFAGYTIAISILRIAGWGRLIYGIIEGPAFARNLPFLGRGMPTGGWLFTALPIAIAICAYATKLDERSRLSIMVFSLFALLNHALALLLIMVSFVWSFMMAPAFFRIGGPFIVGGTAIFMGVLFKYCRDLGRLRQDDPSKALGDWDALVISILIGSVFLLSYSLQKSPIQLSEQFGRSWGERDVKLIELKDCTEVESQVWGMQLSPNGKLLALACYKGVAVLDAQTREQLFQDDTINAYSVRFSASGKYLAAGGIGVSDDESCIAVYEVDGFRRLSQVSIQPNARSLYTREVLDVAFRSDENSIVCVYYDYIDDAPFYQSRGEWKALVEKEGFSVPPKWTKRCIEIELSSGRVIDSEVFEGSEAGSSNSFVLSPNGDTLLYIHEFDEMIGEGEKQIQSKGRRHVSFIDTTTWLETVRFQNDPKRRVRNLFTDLLDSGKLFFIYRRTHLHPGAHFKDTYYLPTLSSREDVFVEWDVESDVSKDIVSSDIGKRAGYLYTDFRGRAQLSPDRLKFALLGTNRKDRDRNQPQQEEKDNFYIVKVDREMRHPPEVRQFRLNFEKHRVSSIVWLDNDRLAVAAIAVYGTDNRINKNKIFFIEI